MNVNAHRRSIVAYYLRTLLYRVVHRLYIDKISVCKSSYIVEHRRVSSYMTVDRLHTVVYLCGSYVDCYDIRLYKATAKILKEASTKSHLSDILRHRKWVATRSGALLQQDLVFKKIEVLCHVF